jgi:hypothetical protein
MTVIAITGRKGSGKDTAAQVLINHGFPLVKFADPLKNMLRTLLSYRGADEVMIERLLEGDLKETPSEYLEGQTPRLAMQTLGTEWGRNLIGERLWTDSAKRRLSSVPHAVVTDMRFPNELRTVKELDAVVIRVVRPGLNYTDSSKHASEGYIDDMPVDFEIINDGSISELHDKLLIGLRKRTVAMERAL